MARHIHRSRSVVANNRSPLVWSEIAHAAARLMAEDGITDHHLAKKKALRTLGLPETHALPPNDEVDAALAEYHTIFHNDEHLADLRFLRQTAVDLMRLLERFTPYLTGSVLDGTAGHFSSIDLLLFADSAKDVEIFLLNEDLEFHHGAPRDERIEAVFVLEDDEATANLVVLRPDLERIAFKHRDGRTRARARIDAVQALLAQMPAADAAEEAPEAPQASPA